MFSRFKKNKAQIPPPPPAHPVNQIPNYPLMPVMQSAPSFGWGKALGMLFAVLIPAGLVIYANTLVFPDSSWLATGMVISTCGIALIFTIASGKAAQKTRRYCLSAHLLLGIVLAANVAVHWVMSREKSAAQQATTARHEEEDRAEKFRDAEAKRQKDLFDSQAKMLNAEARRNNTARRLGYQAPRGATISAPASVFVTSASTIEQADETPRLTVEQVMGKYSKVLLWFAIADLLVSVVAFGVCAMIWEWDRNRNGIPDHLEQFLFYQQYFAQQQAQAVAPAQTVAAVTSATPIVPQQSASPAWPVTPVHAQNGSQNGVHRP